MKDKPTDPQGPWPKPIVKPGTYSDGHPLDNINYLECKLILRGERFTSAESFHEFSRLVSKAAQISKVDFDTSQFVAQRPQIREVLFLDTKDFRLYNNAFILRRRIAYQDGFLVGDPEIVFKYRHPDLQTAAEMDVRPTISGSHKVKFKTEVLPLKDKLGGYRLLYSHNVEFPLSAVPRDHIDMQIAMTGRHIPMGAQHDPEQTSMSAVMAVLPALQKLNTTETDRIEFVNHTAVEEVLLDIGTLDFGKGVEPKANVSVWRTRGDQRQLVGEFSFQCKFQRASDLHDKALLRCQEFFCSLQHITSDWISLGTTKTGAVYRLKGQPPQSHE